MRSVLLSLVLAAGALGLALATPAQTRADELVGPAITSGDTIPVAHWHGGWYGRGFYPGYGGFYRGYYPGFYRGYYPGFYRPYGGFYRPYGGFYRRYYYGGGFYPYGGYGAWPYSGYYGW